MNPTPNQPTSAATVGPEAKDAAKAISKTIQAYVSGCDPNFLKGLVERRLQAAITSATANLRRELDESKADSAIHEKHRVDNLTSCLENKDRADKAEAHLSALRLDVAALRESLIECFFYLSKQIDKRPLNETAADGTQSLSSKLAKLLDDLTTTRPDLVAVGRGELDELRKDKERLEAVRLAALAEIKYDAEPALEKYVTGTIQRAHRILSTGEPDGVLKTAAIDSAATAKGRAL